MAGRVNAQPSDWYKVPHPKASRSFPPLEITEELVRLAEDCKQIEVDDEEEGREAEDRSEEDRVEGSEAGEWVSAGRRGGGLLFSCK